MAGYGDEADQAVTEPVQRLKSKVRGYGDAEDPIANLSPPPQQVQLPSIPELVQAAPGVAVDAARFGGTSAVKGLASAAGAGAEYVRQLLPPYFESYPPEKTAAWKAQHPGDDRYGIQGPVEEGIKSAAGYLGFPWAEPGQGREDAPLRILDAAVQAGTAGLAMGGPRGALLRLGVAGAGGAAGQAAAEADLGPGVQAAASLITPLVVGATYAGLMRPTMAQRTFQAMWQRSGSTAAQMAEANRIVLASIPRDAMGRPTGPPAVTWAKAIARVNPAASEFVAMENEISRAAGGAQVMAQWQNRVVQQIPETAQGTMTRLSPDMRPTDVPTRGMQESAQTLLGNERRAVQAQVRPLFQQSAGVPVPVQPVAGLWNGLMGLADEAGTQALKTQFIKMANDLVTRWEVRGANGSWEATTTRPSMDRVVAGEARPADFNRTIGPLHDWLREWEGALAPDNPLLGLDPEAAQALRTAAGRTVEMRRQFAGWLRTQSDDFDTAMTQYETLMEQRVRPLEQGPVGKLAADRDNPSMTAQSSALGLSGTTPAATLNQTADTVARLAAQSPVAARNWVRAFMEQSWASKAKVGAAGAQGVAPLKTYSDWFLHGPNSTHLRAAIEALPGGQQLYAGARIFAEQVDMLATAPDMLPETVHAHGGPLMAREGMSLPVPKLPMYVTLFRRRRGGSLGFPTEAANREFAQILTDPVYQGRVARLAIVPPQRRQDVARGILADWLTSHPDQGDEQ